MFAWNYMEQQRLSSEIGSSKESVLFAVLLTLNFQLSSFNF